MIDIVFPFILIAMFIMLQFLIVSYFEIRKLRTRNERLEHQVKQFKKQESIRNLRGEDK